MTDTTTTCGALSVRAWISAALATALVALTGALTTPAQAEPHPDHRPTYPVTADLDGRATPSLGAEAVVKENFLRKEQEVRVICQAKGDRAYGSRIWDLVPHDGDTYFVPDRFIKTGTNGRAPEIRRCGKKDFKRVTRPPTPHPPTQP
jgi:hypothetical protein